MGKKKNDGAVTPAAQANATETPKEISDIQMTNEKLVLAFGRTIDKAPLTPKGLRALQALAKNPGAFRAIFERAKEVAGERDLQLNLNEVEDLGARYEAYQQRRSELRNAQTDTDAPLDKDGMVTCFVSRCQHRFQPQSRNKVDSQSKTVMTYEKGPRTGEVIREGDFLINGQDKIVPICCRCAGPYFSAVRDLPPMYRQRHTYQEAVKALDRKNGRYVSVMEEVQKAKEELSRGGRRW